MADRSVNDVRAFWETSPLWSGESKHKPGTKEFFEEHRAAVIQDGFAGRLDERIFPCAVNREAVLDLGCGPGFWTVELSMRGSRNVTAADITYRALELTRIRCALYGIRVSTAQQNAERMSFADGAFSHVNCQGVIHHTPDTIACVAEIARVLRPGGTASISVYFHNLLLRNWHRFSWLGSVLSAAGAKLRGRGREGIFLEKDPTEIVRLFDGENNPIGKSYSRAAFLAILERFFTVEETFVHFFPARTLPLRLPSPLHRWLDAHVGFLIYANVTKRVHMGGSATARGSLR